MVEKLEGEIAERRALQPDRRIAAARKKGRWGQLWATAMHSMKGSEERAIRHAPHLRPLVLHGWEDRWGVGRIKRRHRICWSDASPPVQ